MKKLALILVVLFVMSIGMEVCLASYGPVVAAPQHSKSSWERFRPYFIAIVVLELCEVIHIVPHSPKKLKEIDTSAVTGKK